MRDNALSELIGFILIIAILVIMAALYMTYVVPTQGRDTEIEHMQEIEKFFIDFKMNMDSLWLNNQIDVPMNSIVTLGTKGPNTGGSFSVFPLLEPAGSAGTLSISSDDTFLLDVDGIFVDEEGDATLEDIGTSTIVKSNTDLIYYYTTPPVLDGKYPASFYSNQKDWIATFRLKNIPYVSDIHEVYSNGSVNFSSNKQYDLTVSVNKSGMRIAEDWVVYANVSPNTQYYINLLDEAYGLNNDVEFPFIVNTTGGSLLKRTGKGYRFIAGQKEEFPIGQMRYDSHNHYWVDQTYEYRLDGIFLEQGNTSLPKINPGIKLTRSVLPDGRIIPEMHLTIFSIDNSQQNISTSDPVQVSGTVTGVTSNIIGSQTLAQVKPNAKEIRFALFSNQTNPERFVNSTNQTLNQLFTSVNLTGLNATSIPVWNGTQKNGVLVQISGSSTGDEPDCYLQVDHITSQIKVESYAPTTF